MKIIKSFESNGFIEQNHQISDGYSTYYKPPWYWGLGDDGLLYGKGTCPEYYYSDWHRYDQMNFAIPLEEIFKIANEFKNLSILL